MKYAIGTIFLSVLCIILTAINAAGIEPVLSGDCKIAYSSKITAGPFLQKDKSDILVLGSDTVEIAKSISSPRTGPKFFLLSFDGKSFQKRWVLDKIINLKPSYGENAHSRLAWCCGDFDGDGLYSLVTCDSNRILEYTFSEAGNNGQVSSLIKQIKARDIWIDQLIASDIDGDSIDEIVSLEFPNKIDTCCSRGNTAQYHSAVYKISGDTLITLKRPLYGVGGYNDVVTEDHFISKAHFDGYPGEVPIIMGPQSDVSPSSYLSIGKTESGEYEVIRPIPRPILDYVPKGIFDKARKFGQEEPSRGSVYGPSSGKIFNDGEKVLHYGYFIDNNAPDSIQKQPDGDGFAILENGAWRQLQKTDRSIGGLMTSFEYAPGKRGWLFIKQEKYQIYDKLPVVY